ncbi:MAG: peptidoglycan-binding protein [Pyrinomonadaceae bacterium]
MRILREGISGEDVGQWQDFLSRQGFPLSKIDGVFGVGTRQATAAFQAAHGLNNDGIVGSLTLSQAAQLGLQLQSQPAIANNNNTITIGGASSVINDEILKQIMPRLPQAKLASYLPFLKQAMEEFSINSPLRAAAFLAQVAHESGEFKFMEEIWGPTDAQRRYEPVSKLARGLGNTEPGDGKRFKGRGPIQVTGRSNYRMYGQLLGVDLISDPNVAATPEVAFRIAGLYWHRNGLNELADQQMLRTITKRINGGFNGLAERLKYYEQAKRIYGLGGVTRGLCGAPADTGDDSAIPVFTRGSEAIADSLDQDGQMVSARPSVKAVKVNSTTKAGKAVGTKSSAKKAGAKKASKDNSSVRGTNKVSGSSRDRRAATKAAVKGSSAKKKGRAPHGTKQS